MCGPRGLPGEHDHLFHNNGDGTFTDVSKQLGVDDPNGYYGLGAFLPTSTTTANRICWWPTTPLQTYLYINKGDGTFEDQSYISGYALNGDGREVANMGIAAGDYLNNGHLDIVNTDFANDYNVLFQNDGTGAFTDVSYLAGIASLINSVRKFWRRVPRLRQRRLERSAHRQWPRLSAGRQHPEWGQVMPSARFSTTTLRTASSTLVPAVEGTGLAVVSVGRGAAFGDLFNDGKIDVVVNNMDGVPVLLRNVNPDHHHWVELNSSADRRALAMPSAQRSISPPAASASAKTSSAAEAIYPQTTCAFTSVWPIPRKSTTLKFTGPAAPSKK